MTNCIKVFSSQVQQMEIRFFRKAGFPQSLYVHASTSQHCFEIPGKAIIVGNQETEPDLLSSLTEAQQDAILITLGESRKIWVSPDNFTQRVYVFQEIDLSTFKLEMERWQQKLDEVITKLAECPVSDLSRLKDAALNLLKMTSFKKWMALHKMAMYHFGLPKKELEAEAYLTEGKRRLKDYCLHRASEPEIDREVWLNIATCCLKQIKLSSLGIRLPIDRKTVLFEGLSALNKAIEIKEDYQAIHYKYLLLQMLYDMKEQLPEDHLVCMKHMLDIDPNIGSQGWLNYAQIYGQELAKQRKYSQSIEWFNHLKRSHPHPINDLYLGKIEDEKGEILSSIAYFESAQSLCSNDTLKSEVSLWLLSAKIKQQQNVLQVAKEFPKENDVGVVIDLFNEFCSAICQVLTDYPGEETSTYISFGELASFFCLNTYPQMADLLLKLQQFRFAIYLHEQIIMNFPLFVAHKYLFSSAETQIFAAKGTAFFLLGENDQAEEAFKKALALDANNLGAYQNLIGVYAKCGDFDKLRGLLEEVQKIKEGNNEQMGDIYFNLGVAFCHKKEQIEEAQGFFRTSLEHDPDNWNTKVHLARALVATKRYEEAKIFLMEYLDLCEEIRGPFHAFSRMQYQIYFTLAGVSAICGDMVTANKSAVEAGKTKFGPDAIHELQSYLYELKQPGSSTGAIFQAIQESILKMAFTYRVGNVINSSSICVSAGTFVGYHGTSDKFISEFANGIEPRCTEIRQYSGEGFYVTDDREIASYFAMKKTKEVTGTPILIKVYAKEGLVGERNTKFKENQASKKYDFMSSPINGFEKFSQSYVFKNSLRKLQPSLDEVEKVEWTQDKYEQFIKEWTRRSC